MIKASKKSYGFVCFQHLTQCTIAGPMTVCYMLETGMILCNVEVALFRALALHFNFGMC